MELPPNNILSFLFYYFIHVLILFTIFLISMALIWQVVFLSQLVPDTSPVTRQHVQNLSFLSLILEIEVASVVITSGNPLSHGFVIRGLYILPQGLRKT